MYISTHSTCISPAMWKLKVYVNTCIRTCVTEMFSHYNLSLIYTGVPVFILSKYIYYTVCVHATEELTYCNAITVHLQLRYDFITIELEKSYNHVQFHFD